MKKYKNLSYAFAILAILLSDVMCASVAYNYSYLQWGARYEAFSAPASVSFLLVPPYAVGIAICVIAALVFRKKYCKSI